MKAIQNQIKQKLNEMKGEKMIKAEEMFMELGFEKSTLINKNNVARYKIPNSQNFVAFYKNDDGTTKIDYKIGARYNKKKRFMECVNKQMEEIKMIKPERLKALDKMVELWREEV